MTGKNLTASVLLLAVAVVLVSPTSLQAATLAVPANYPTIAAAFDAARSGDRIELAPGVYRENHLVLPNGVTLAGVIGDPAAVTIDGQGQGRILLAEGLDQTTLITNIRFINGRAAGHTSYDRSGGAIFCSNSNLRISICIFENNASDGQGGAIRCNKSSPLITGCLFVGNDAGSGGGGAIDCSFFSSPLIKGCEFRDNTAAWGGALSCRGYSSPSVSTSLFKGNSAVGAKGYGGGVFADFGSTPVFRLSTFVENAARYGGAFACLSGSETNLENCTVVANSAQILGGGLFSYEAAPRVTSSIFTMQDGTGISAEGGLVPQISCSDIFGNSRGDWVGDIAYQLAAGDNLSVDPLFCTSDDGSNESFALEDNSPCGSPELTCGYMGAWPVGCNVVGTSILTFDAQWRDQDAELTWQTQTQGGAIPHFRLVGSSSTAPDEEWDVPIEDLGGGYYIAQDDASSVSDGATYTYRLFMALADDSWVLVKELTLSSVPEFPGIHDLSAWPNPFNPMTTISFRLGKAQRTRISIFSPDGRRVAVLADRELNAGPHTQTWDGRNSNGGAVSSGTYIVLVEGAIERRSQKITLLK